MLRRKEKRDARIAASTTARETHEAESIVQRAMLSANASGEEEGEVHDAHVPLVPPMQMARTETIPMSDVVTEPVPKTGRMGWYLGLKEGEDGAV